MKSYFKHKLRSKNPIVIIGTVIFIAILIVTFIVLFGLVLMYLWNWLMPELFGLGTIGFWQALGIGLLAKLLFGFGGDRDKEKKCKHDESRKRGKSSKGDFSKWKHYESFWQEEGKKAFNEYINRQNDTFEEDIEGVSDTE